MKPCLLRYDAERFYLDDEPFQILSGDVHYFRLVPADWERRLDLALDFGLNTVQVYVPWNFHEPRPGQYDFSGMRDLGAFLRLCGEKGLRVLLRPSPYMCSEWDLGGLPSWLLKGEEIALRTRDERYMAAVRRYYDRLIPEFLPYLSTKGGPIIAVAVENEYGSFANDHVYVARLAQILRDHGVDVPLYTTDGDNPRMLIYGHTGVDGFAGANYTTNVGDSAHAVGVVRTLYPDQPFYSGEFWVSGPLHWGEPFRRRDPVAVAAGYEEALRLGGNINMYMFSGGTNFGFYNGANFGRSALTPAGTPARYIPRMTSYDEDSPVYEDGTVGEKYYLLRDELDKALGKPARPHVPPMEHKTQVPAVTLDRQALLFDNLDALTERKTDAVTPLPMEEYDRDYGLILYTQTADGYDTACSEWLWLDRMKDRATVFADGNYFATFMRDRGVKTAGAAVKDEGGRPSVAFRPEGKPVRLDVLVENLGRICYGPEMQTERKGMYGMHVGLARLIGCTTRTIPLSDLSGLAFTERRPLDTHQPVFLSGRFDAVPGVDTYVDTHGFGHGNVWINGFNLGRYDEAGPQYTLYVPGSLLKEKDNEVILLDLAPDGGTHETLAFTDHLILEGDAAPLA